MGGEPTFLPGENREDPFYKPDRETGQQLEKGRATNVFGPNKKGHLCSQGTTCSKIGNVFPGNVGARVHDYWLNAREAAGLSVTKIHNVGTMLPAYAVGYAAVVGQSLSHLSTQKLIDLSVSSSFDRDDDRQALYGAATIGLR